MTRTSINLPKGTQVGLVRLGRLLIRDEAGRYALYGAPGGMKVLMVTADAAEGVFAYGGSSDNATLFDADSGSFKAVISQTGCQLERLDRLKQPRNKGQAVAFARALSLIPDAGLSLANSFFAEHLGTILCINGDASDHVTKEIALGRYLSNGAEIEGNDLLRMEKACTRLTVDELAEVAGVAGLPVPEIMSNPAGTLNGHRDLPVGDAGEGKLGPFELAGRPELQAFFNEHVIDVINDIERYRRLGIGFPGGVLLYGPPGCGKTFAVEKLIEHLKWPSQSVDASSIASPYIHETSRRIAEVFRKAIETAPSVIMIDELDAFLSSRDSDNQSHRIEEVAEFLRRIPEAAENQVLLIGMTNRLEAIDPAILRRGRFDHLIEVGPASVQEIESLLRELLKGISNEVESVVEHARALEGRPLSDVAHVVKDAARFTAKSGRETVTDHDFERSLKANRPRQEERPRIGF